MQREGVEVNFSPTFVWILPWYLPTKTQLPLGRAWPLSFLKLLIYKCYHFTKSSFFFQDSFFFFSLVMFQCNVQWEDGLGEWKQREMRIGQEMKVPLCFPPGFWG